MRFTITHPMHSHPYNPEFLSGDGIGQVAAATCPIPSPLKNSGL